MTGAGGQSAWPHLSLAAHRPLVLSNLLFPLPHLQSSSLKNCPSDDHARDRPARLSREGVQVPCLPKPRWPGHPRQPASSTPWGSPPTQAACLSPCHTLGTWGGDHTDRWAPLLF